MKFDFGMGSGRISDNGLWRAAALLLAVGVAAQAQLYIYPADVTFRTAYTANNSTTHYGDLNLNGGTTGNQWGWITAQQARIYGYTYIGGDLTVAGAKNFIQPHPTDSTKAIRYIALEAGEALTLARGLARTDGGIAKIDLPEDFALVTSNKAPLTVLLTVEGVPALVFVKSKAKESITVALKDSDLRDYGDVDFAYQVTGVRDGFENQNPIVPLEEVAIPKAIAKEGPAQKRMKDFNDRIQKIVVTARAKK